MRTITRRAEKLKRGKPGDTAKINTQIERDGSRHEEHLAQNKREQDLRERHSRASGANWKKGLKET